MEGFQTHKTCEICIRILLICPDRKAFLRQLMVLLIDNTSRQQKSNLLAQQKLIAFLTTNAKTFFCVP
jgi:hypothetical protein